MDSIYTFNDLMNISKFIKSIQRQAKKYNIKLNITDEKFVHLSDNIKCGGYFQERERKTPGIIEVATNKPIDKWLSILVHETGHMDQWIEQCDIWVKYDNVNPNIMDSWLEGKDYSENTIEKVINAARDMELDCEKRAVDKIKKYKLPINVGDYIQKANCYIFFYNYLKITRKWCSPNNSPYNNPKIYKYSNRTWYDDYSTIPKEILQAFKKYKI